MQTTQPLKRATTADQAADAVRQFIVDGRLADGERINEVHLSVLLGVSRTPVREALARLASEGTLTSSPNLGYFVRPLAVDEFEQLYALRPLLDPEALRLAGLPDARTLARLREINRALDAAKDAEAAIGLDDEWHRALIAACPNRILLEMIDGLIHRTRRYELALLRETREVHRATREHEAVHKALAAKDLGAACAALKRNLESGRAPVVAWLTGREASR